MYASNNTNNINNNNINNDINNININGYGILFENTAQFTKEYTKTAYQVYMVYFIQ